MARLKKRTFSRILVPLDGSDNAYKALEYAVQLASKYESKLTLLHVAEEPRYVIPKGESMAVPKRIVEYGEEILRVGKSVAEKTGIDADTELLRGDPAEQIINYVKKQKFDLIVMGTRGLSQIKSLVFGSVSDKVIHFSNCNVLLVRPDSTNIK